MSASPRPDWTAWLAAWWVDPQAVAATVVARLGSDHSAACSALVIHLGDALQRRQWRAATAESCTGGGIAAALTAVAGSSAWVEGGFVTYSNAAKMRLLGVPEAVLQAHGAVSLPVVQAMAAGALQGLACACAVAVSGVAGPGGGSPDKPVGTVCLAWAVTADGGTEAAPAADPVASSAGIRALRLQFPGNRDDVRAGTVWCALLGLLALAERNQPPFSGPG